MALTTPPPIDLEEEDMLAPHSEFAAAEGYQPVEETANSVDDPPSERFTWTIENFSKLTHKKVYSNVFFVGGYKWRVLIFPKGNNSDHLSVYLDVADFSTLPYGWSKNIQLSLAVVNQVNSEFTIRKDTQHRFNARTNDWGFTSFMPLSDLYDPSRGYLLNDTFIVEADVAVADPPTTRFTWAIENFSRLTSKTLCSDVFFVGGYKWRVLIYPKGNSTEHLSMYLDAADSITLPYGWSRHAQFSLAMVNQIHDESTIQKDAEHEFNTRESDWGFTSFMPLSDLYDPRRGYLLNDTCIVEADVAVLELEGNEMLAPHSEFAVAEGSQSVEENANAVDASIADDSPSVRFTWKIENFSRLTRKKLYSHIFFVGGYKWRVLMYPKGNNTDHLSMYLDIADSTTSPHGWSRNALFSLAVVNQIHSEFTISKDAEHEFNARESDWGFTSFMPLSDLYDPRKGYLLNDTCIVEADVVVLELEEEEMSVPHFEFAAGEGSQPVEGNANAVDAPIVDDSPSVRFTWKIENFSRLTRKKLYSHIFFVGGYKWRVLMYPKGNNTDHLSMYLDVADSTTSPHGWSRNALFSLAVVNQIHSEFTLSKDTKHQFNALESDWGFTSFMPLSDLYDLRRGYLLNDTCIVEADVVVLEDVDVKSSMPNLGSLSING